MNAKDKDPLRKNIFKRTNGGSLERTSGNLGTNYYDFSTN